MKVGEFKPDMTDDELVNYARIHCYTDRALFHIDHVKRLYALAGIELPVFISTFFGNQQFVSLHEKQAAPLFAAIAKRRLRASFHVIEGGKGKPIPYPSTGSRVRWPQSVKDKIIEDTLKGCEE